MKQTPYFMPVAPVESFILYFPMYDWCGSILERNVEGESLAGVLLYDVGESCECWGPIILPLVECCRWEAWCWSWRYELLCPIASCDLVDSVLCNHFGNFLSWSMNAISASLVKFRGALQKLSNVNSVLQFAERFVSPFVAMKMMLWRRYLWGNRRPSEPIWRKFPSQSWTLTPTVKLLWRLTMIFRPKSGASKFWLDLSLHLGRFWVSRELLHYYLHETLLAISEWNLPPGSLVLIFRVIRTD